MRLERQLESVNKYSQEFCKRLKEDKDIYALERLAQLLIQSLLDLFAMIAFEKTGRKPDTYKELAIWFAQHSQLSTQDEKFLVSLAGFRNLLVYGYAQLDTQKEEMAFSEIRERMRALLEKLKREVKGDPTISDVQKIKKVLKKFGVKYAYLFGSIARTGRGRDLDLALVANGSALTLGALLEEIAHTLGIREELVDLVDLNSAHLGLLKTIIDEGIVILGGKNAREFLEKKYLELLEINPDYA